MRRERFSQSIVPPTGTSPAERETPAAAATDLLAIDGENARIVGVLHDVAEDTDVTFDDLRAEGFSEAVLEALALVTHKDDRVSYSEYVVRAKANRIARQVKIADLRDNTSLGRVLRAQADLSTNKRKA